jgi:hypothetical protein
MSVATMDPEVSIAMMMVARSLGTLALAPGRANAVISSASTARNAIAARWRRQPGRWGASLASISGDA